MLYSVDQPSPEHPAVRHAAAVLARGGLVAFPTETVYGLGAHALDARAVKSIFAAKGRPADNPLIVHVGTADEAFALSDVELPMARGLAAAFWPGPLTMVVPRGKRVPLDVTAGLDTLAVRVPDHPVATALLACFKGPIAAPSANRSGRPSPTRADHVMEDLDGRIDLVLDGGETAVGLESTVLDLTGPRPRLLRPGAISADELEPYTGPLDRPLIFSPDTAGDEPLPSPGLKYRHYAPDAPATVVVGTEEGRIETFRRLWQSGKGRDGFLVSNETAAAIEGMDEDEAVFLLGPRQHLDEAARRLYQGLRSVDRPGLCSIYIEACDLDGIGAALMDRMVRAAEGRMLHADGDPVS